MATDTITYQTASEIDAAWINAGMPHDGLRIVGYRVSGNGTISYLEVPGRYDTPCYCYNNGRYLHVTGPTLAEWQQAQDDAEVVAMSMESQDAATCTPGRPAANHRHAPHRATHSRQGRDWR